MEARIHAIGSDSCGPTAVCSVTGQSSGKVIKAMAQAAAEDGPVPSHWKDSAYRHQARACEFLGFDLFNSSGTKISAATLPMAPKIRQDAYLAAPNIPDFVRQNNCPDVLLVRAFRADTREAHTFALDGGNYFDNNTNQIVQADRIPPIFARFKVTHVLRVRQSEAVDDAIRAAINNRDDER